MINVPHFDDICMTEKETAQYFGISKSWLEKQRVRGKRVPTYIKFDTGEVIYSLRSVRRFKNPKRSKFEPLDIFSDGTK